MTYKMENKAKTQLIDPCFIEGMARVQEIGDQKHVDHHWLKGVSVAEILGAIDRHINAIKLGEICDDETREQHAYHAACGLMYIAHYCRNPSEYDEFFDLIYSRSPDVGGGMGRLPIPESYGPGLSNQTTRGDRRAIRESIGGRVSGRDAFDPGLVSSNGGKSGNSADQEIEN